MAPKLAKRRELKNIGYEIFIGALSILSIVNLFMLAWFVYDPDIQAVLYLINAIMMPIFLGDFIYRLFTAESRSRLLLSRLRLGGPALQPSVPTTEALTCIPAVARDPAFYGIRLSQPGA